MTCLETYNGAPYEDRSEVCRTPLQDFNTLKAAENETPFALHSHGGTIYVLDRTHERVYAYNLSTKIRDTTKEFDLIADEVESAHGIWSNGETMWVLDNKADDPDELYAYKLTAGTDYGARDEDKDITLASANGFARGGIWSNEETMWVGNDAGPDKIFAYKLTPGPDYGDRDSGRDIDLPGANTNPAGLWSDGTTVWVVDNATDQLFAYNLSSKASDEDKEFDLDTDNANPRGITSDGRTMWVADLADDKIYAYLLPGSFFE